MKKLLVILSFLILSSCTPQEEPPQVNNNPPEIKWGYQKSILSASSKIKETKEFAECMEPAVKMCVSTVGMRFAQNTKSTDFCNELPDTDQQEGCRFAITISNAIEKNDQSLCSTLTGNYLTQCNDAIYQSQAVATKNIVLCDKLEEGEKRDQCILSIISSDNTTKEEACKKIQTPSLQNMCIISLKNRPTLPKK